MQKGIEFRKKINFCRNHERKKNFKDMMAFEAQTKYIMIF